MGWAQSLIATCAPHGFDPYVYLVDVLRRLGSHPFSRIGEHTTKLWKSHIADRPMRLLLDRATA